MQRTFLRTRVNPPAGRLSHDQMLCLVCRQSMSGPYRGYWFECLHCGFLASDLTPAIGGRAEPAVIDEPSRRASLETLRRLNFERTLDQVGALRAGQRLSLLDVGCAHGWFLQAAARRGHTATGIEPDSRVAEEARAGGVTVLSGFFPNDLPPDASFDVISFNDVLEHLPDPGEAADACFKRLNAGGLLVITIPSSEGVLFRTARFLGRLGLGGPLDRLWQRGFPSPHLSYFHPNGLASFLRAHAFREVHRSSLPSFCREGLWPRLRYDRRAPLAASAALFVLLYLLSPVLALLPSDISFQVFQPVREEGGGGA